jgi:hypothetical protein
VVPGIAAGATYGVTGTLAHDVVLDAPLTQWVLTGAVPVDDVHAVLTQGRYAVAHDVGLPVIIAVCMTDDILAECSTGCACCGD